MFTLKGRTMVITGGAGNNGSTIVNAALEAGMNVALLSGMHTKAQKAIAEKINPKYRDHVIGIAQNPKAKWEENLAAAPEIYETREHMSDMIRLVYERFGSVDVVVNAKGGHIRYDFEHTDKAIWRHSMEVVESAFVNAKNALPYLLESKAARIINITTCDARNGGYFLDPSFAAARAGLEALTYELAKELGPKGITSNCILVGHCEGDVPEEDALSDEERAKMISKIPVGRMMVPQDLVGAFMFLASEEASFVNGARIDINGGLIVG
ncbi:MAG: SDR family oxidoreductase [Lachnospiraceae bacterium]|nr:SDR family oxidoreductase [Lachnospiraceae bacterium]